MTTRNQTRTATPVTEAPVETAGTATEAPTEAPTIAENAVELALRGILGTEAYEKLTEQERRDKWIEVTNATVKGVKKESKDAGRTAAQTEATNAIKAAITKLVTDSNFAMADRYISGGALRFSFEPDTGLVSFNPRPASPLTFKRGKLTDEVRATLAPKSTDEGSDDESESADADGSDKGDAPDA